MDRNSKIRFSRAFYIGATILLLWILLSGGIHSLLKGYLDWTTYLLLGLSVVVLVAIYCIFKLKLDEKEIDRERVKVALAIFVGFGILTIYNLFRPRYSVAADASFWRLHELISLCLLVFIILQIVASLRAGSSNE